MKQKKYMSIPSMACYAAGGFGQQFCFTFISSYMLLYLTDAVGLKASIVGTLMLISKIFDGISDVFFGSLIDRTNTKWGKARPWLIGAALPMAITQILLFAIPEMSEYAQYAWFFIFYCALNAVFYTANGCAFNTLSALLTYNPAERVIMSSVSYITGSVAGILIPIICTKIVAFYDNPATGWRTVALVFAVIMFVCMVVNFFGVKELPPEGSEENNSAKTQKISFLEIVKIVITNKYYLIMLLIQILIACIGPCFFTSGAYYCQWILGDGTLLSAFSVAFSMGMLIGMIINPIFVAKIGYRRTMGWMNVVSCVFLIVFVIGSFNANLPVSLAAMFLKNMTGFASVGCCMNAAIADIAKYSYRQHGVHVEGSMYSCTSMGQKIGQGVTAWACGVMLTASGYVGTASVQTADALMAIKVMFAVIPFILTVLLTVCCFSLKIEEKNKEWEQEHSETV